MHSLNLAAKAQMEELTRFAEELVTSVVNAIEGAHVSNTSRGPGVTIPSAWNGEGELPGDFSAPLVQVPVGLETREYADLVNNCANRHSYIGEYDPAHQPPTRDPTERDWHIAIDARRAALGKIAQFASHAARIAQHYAARPGKPYAGEFWLVIARPFEFEQEKANVGEIITWQVGATLALVPDPAFQKAPAFDRTDEEVLRDELAEAKQANAALREEAAILREKTAGFGTQPTPSNDRYDIGAEALQDKYDIGGGAPHDKFDIDDDTVRAHSRCPNCGRGGAVMRLGVAGIGSIPGLEQWPVKCAQETGGCGWQGIVVELLPKDEKAAMPGGLPPLRNVRAESVADFVERMDRGETSPEPEVTEKQARAIAEAAERGDAKALLEHEVMRDGRRIRLDPESGGVVIERDTGEDDEPTGAPV